MNEPLLQIKNLYKRFGSNEVLTGVNLDLHSQDSLVVLGLSGSGKSVLIKLLLGLLPLDKGSVFLKGQEITKKLLSSTNPIRNQGEILFQNSALFDSIPIWHNIAFPLIMKYKWPENKAREKANELLKEVGLDSSCESLFPAEVSGGMRKRIGLARALITNPKILFCDEPTTGLDPISAHLIDHLIHSLSIKYHTTVLTITHDMNSVSRIASKVAMLYHGKIIWSDNIKHIFNSDNEIVDQFVSGKLEGPIDS